MDSLNKIKLHVLKIQANHLYDVLSGAKKAELRKDDRDFKVGDLIHFTDVNGYEYEDVVNNLASNMLFRITHILDASAVIPNIGITEYVILSIERYN